MTKSSPRRKNSVHGQKCSDTSKCNCFYQRNSITLRDKIFRYRNMRRSVFIFMSATIIFLILLNYSTLQNSRCNQSVDLVDDYDTKIQTSTNQAKNVTVDILSFDVVTAETTLQHSLSQAQPLMSDKPEFKIPDFFDKFGHLKNKGRVMYPRFLQQSKNRTKKFITIGVPTVKRKKGFYLKMMLTSLFESLNSDTVNVRSEVLVVVMIAEIDDLTYIQYLINDLNGTFRSEIDSGLLEIIVPEKDYYPNFDRVVLTDRIFGDKPSRVKWRRKQNYDISYLMSYCYGKGLYYLQLEDDVATSLKLVSTIRKYIDNLDNSWFIAEFCDLGFIGKLYHDKDLALLVNYFLMFSDLMPVDILAIVLQNTLICDPSKNSIACQQTIKLIVKRYNKSLFQHIGHESSLDGKVQNLKSKNFEGITNIAMHNHPNPPANITTSLLTYDSYSLINCYNGKTFFWGIKENVEDLNVTFISFKFTPPVVLSSMRIKSGNIFHPADVIPMNANVLLRSANKGERKRNRGFFKIKEVDSDDIRISIDIRVFGKIEEVRIEILKKFDNWILINDIEFVVHENKTVGVI